MRTYFYLVFIKMLLKPQKSVKIPNFLFIIHHRFFLYLISMSNKIQLKQNAISLSKESDLIIRIHIK